MSTLKYGASCRIEICGGIASGKTTLAKLLKRQGFLAAFEDFRANPFWKLFYSDPGQFAFETEITFLLQHYSLIKRSLHAFGPFVFDYSLFLDRAYAETTLNNAQCAVFREVFKYIFREIGPPFLTIHLICGEEEEYRRIQARKRKVERGIKLEYLRSINESAASQIKEYSREVNVLPINSEQMNFADNKIAKAQVIQMTRDALHQ